MAHSCTPETCTCSPKPDETDILARLKRLSSAEDFFRTLGVAFDAGILNVARLHILRRMGEYLATDDLDGLPDRMAFARAKTVLERAYADFVRSTPIQERVFKVHRDAVSGAKGFLPLGVLD